MKNTNYAISFNELCTDDDGRVCIRGGSFQHAETLDEAVRCAKGEFGGSWNTTDLAIVENSRGDVLYYVRHNPSYNLPMPEGAAELSATSRLCWW